MCCMFFFCFVIMVDGGIWCVVYGSSGVLVKLGVI